MPLPSVGLYIHLPWCVQKCPYCDFNSHPLHQALPEADYLEALQADLAFESAREPGQVAIDSIFFGGGTPSLFSGRAIAVILETVNQYYSLSSDAEITLEANPGTAESSYFNDYRAAGVNRLSLGMQSFDDGMLKQLGRIHGAAECLAAFDKARQAGFDNINIDVMFGLPEQSEQAALQDLQQAIQLEPEHLSWYQLTIEPNTGFASQPPPLPADDAVYAMQAQGINQLAADNYRRYEVSAFSRAGRECRHNLNYWQFGDYLGIGAGAHAKLTDTAASGQVVRSMRQRHPKAYMQYAGSKVAIQEENAVASNMLLFEFLLNHLRLLDGFRLADLERMTPVSRDQLREVMQPAVKNGLLEVGGDDCRATARGFRFLNEILLLALPEKGG